MKVSKIWLGWPQLCTYLIRNIQLCSSPTEVGQDFKLVVPSTNMESCFFSLGEREGEKERGKGGREGEMHRRGREGEGRRE